MGAHCVSLGLQLRGGTRDHLSSPPCQTTVRMNCQVVGSLIPTGHLVTTEAATGGKFHGDGFPVINQRKGIKMMEKA